MKLLKLKQHQIVGNEQLKSVKGGSCTSMCSRRGQFFLSQGWSGQDAQNYVSACVSSCDSDTHTLSSDDATDLAQME